MLRTLRTLLTLVLIPLGTPAQTQPAPDAPYTRVVHFEFPAADAQVAYFCGSPTHWECDKLPMRRTGAGVFYANVPLSPGRIEYVFVVDGQPRLDEASMIEHDGKGGQRSWFVLDDDRDAQPAAGIPAGTIEALNLNSQSLGEKRLINVYTPPGYSKKQTYPLLILLHGYGMTEAQWLTGGVQHYLDRYIAAKILQPMIVVMPGAPDEFYTGGPRTMSSTRSIRSSLASTASARARYATAIGGMSMGGFGAFYLAYRHPELFGYAMVLSPETSTRRSSNNSTANSTAAQRSPRPSTSASERATRPASPMPSA